MMDTIRNIQYDKISLLTDSDLSGMSKFNVVFDETKPDTIMTTVYVKFDDKNKTYVFERREIYDSLKEFSTVTMKELLTLYSKRAIIAGDTSYYVKDDPRLHSFLSKLSYPAIEDVAENLVDFSNQFKSGHVTMPLGNVRKYKNQPLYRK